MEKIERIEVLKVVKAYFKERQKWANLLMKLFPNCSVTELDNMTVDDVVRKLHNES